MRDDLHDANAAFTVRACNMYDEMVAAMGVAERALAAAMMPSSRRRVPPSGSLKEAIDAMAEVRAGLKGVLAKVEGQ